MFLNVSPAFFLAENYYKELNFHVVKVATSMAKNGRKIIKHKWSKELILLPLLNKYSK